MITCHPFGMAAGQCYVYFGYIEEDPQDSLNLDNTEFLVLQKFSKNQVLKMISDHQIIHATTLLALYTALARNLL